MRSARGRAPAAVGYPCAHCRAAVFIVLPPRLCYSRAEMARFLMAAVLMASLSLLSPAANPQSGSQETGQTTLTSKEEALAPVRDYFKRNREWEQATTAGIKGELKLGKRVNQNGTAIFIYDLKITGADLDAKYALVDWPIASARPFVKTDGLRIDDDGSVFCPANSTDSCTRQAAGAIVQLVVAPAKGEIMRTAVISEDKKIGAFVSVVPDPIIATDKGCSFEVVRLSPDFVLAVIRGKGFIPGEELLAHGPPSDAGNDSHFNATSDGTIYLEFSPAIKGKKSGRTEVSIRGKNCAPNLAFEWGKKN